jgi:ankyrin repeat protein
MTQLLRFLLFGFCLLTASAQAADNSPLFEAIGREDKAAIEALLAKGADVNARAFDGTTPLLRAAMYRTKDIAELLLAKGADVNARREGVLGGDTPLHVAAGNLRGIKDVVELLLAKGADINARNRFGATPLYEAVRNGNKDVADLLLAKDADVNAKDANGYTPLHKAAMEGRKDVVELLLAKGADINAKNTFGHTPLDEAAAQGKKDVAELLKEHPVKQARLLEYIRNDPRAAFVEMAAQIQGNPADDITRRLIIKLATELKPAPAIPEDARKHFIEGTTIVKSAKNPAHQALAAQSFTEALKIAPWWGDAYYNLGAAQELAEKYNETEQAFNFSLLGNPSEQQKRDMQDRIYALGAKRKLSGAK